MEARISAVEGITLRMIWSSKSIAPQCFSADKSFVGQYPPYFSGIATKNTPSRHTVVTQGRQVAHTGGANGNRPFGKRR
jgi:hypothetical protein